MLTNGKQLNEGLLVMDYGYFVSTKYDNMSYFKNGRAKCLPCRRNTLWRVIYLVQILHSKISDIVNGWLDSLMIKGWLFYDNLTIIGMITVPNAYGFNCFIIRNYMVMFSQDISRWLL
jgi:hypothetical protein